MSNEKADREYQVRMYSKCRLEMSSVVSLCATSGLDLVAAWSLITFKKATGLGWKSLFSASQFFQIRRDSEFAFPNSGVRSSSSLTTVIVEDNAGNFSSSRPLVIQPRFSATISLKIKKSAV